MRDWSFYIEQTRADESRKRKGRTEDLRLRDPNERRRERCTVAG